MITEYIASLMTAAPKWAKHMNFVKEAIAIEARARRCREAWTPHQQQTKEVILDAIKACNHYRTVLVVGSGSCLDIPLAELADKFAQVILVDIVHLLQSKRHGWSHVTHITQDITGQMETLYHNPEILPEIYVPEFYHDVPEIDCVVSVNLASQLSIMPLKYLEGKMSHDENELDRFAKNLMMAHFIWLSGFTCVTALICDKTWERLNGNGQLIEWEDPLYGLVEQKTTKEWNWDVAPRHETRTEFSRRNRVGYWENFQFRASDDFSAR